MNNYCSNCGGPLAGSKFCPNCGEPASNQGNNKVEFVSTEYREPSQRIQSPQELYANPKLPVRKKVKPGCLVFLVIFVLFIIGLVFGTIQTVKNPEAYQTADTKTKKGEKEELLDFDKQSWEGFKHLYISHNNFMKNVIAFSDGNMNSLDFYNACSDAKKYFQTASTSFDYGTNDDEVTYLNGFVSAALSDQQAAEQLMKYIDSGKTSQLSKAQENIQKAKDAFTTIASNRGTLLVKAGLTDKEIKKKVEKDMADLEATDKK